MTAHRRTRIVATLGPSTDTPDRLLAVLKAGVDVARINFSHGSAEEHKGRIARLREAARMVGRPVAVLGDLPGPKLRVKMAAARALAPGNEIAFSTQAQPIHADDLVISEPEMLRDVRPGQRILLDDGRLQGEAIRSETNRLIVRISVGGSLLPNKGINLPDTPLTIAPITERDRAAIAVAAEAGADWLAMSFVRSPNAADELRAAAREFGLDAPVMAKIERPEAVENAEAIVAAFDAIMVARGDLGVEIPLERVPSVQKHLIALARSAGKPVVTATDMLDSMRQNPRPTRAEASDVANAVFDGTDALMLSGETAAGSFPVESVECMNRIAMEAEAALLAPGHPAQTAELRLAGDSIDDYITQSVCALARKTGADAIITPTVSGRTARLVARHRPSATIVAPAPTDDILRRMALTWGLRPALMEFCRRPGDDRLDGAVHAAYEASVVEEGQLVIVLAGHPLEGGERLPTIRLVRIGRGGHPTEP